MHCLLCTCHLHGADFLPLSTACLLLARAHPQKQLVNSGVAREFGVEGADEASPMAQQYGFLIAGS